jgi:hypothetical protein
MIGSMHQSQFVKAKEKSKDEFRVDSKGWLDRVIEYLKTDAEFPCINQGESLPQEAQGDKKVAI